MRVRVRPMMAAVAIVALLLGIRIELKNRSERDRWEGRRLFCMREIEYNRIQISFCEQNEGNRPYSSDDRERSGAHLSSGVEWWGRDFRTWYQESYWRSQIID